MSDHLPSDPILRIKRKYNSSKAQQLKLPETFDSYQKKDEQDWKSAMTATAAAASKMNSVLNNKSLERLNQGSQIKNKIPSHLYEQNINLEKKRTSSQNNLKEEVSTQPRNPLKSISGKPLLNKCAFPSFKRRDSDCQREIDINVQDFNEINKKKEQNFQDQGNLFQRRNSNAFQDKFALSNDSNTLNVLGVVLYDGNNQQQTEFTLSQEQQQYPLIVSSPQQLTQSCKASSSKQLISQQYVILKNRRVSQNLLEMSQGADLKKKDHQNDILNSQKQEHPNIKDKRYSLEGVFEQQKCNIINSLQKRNSLDSSNFSSIKKGQEQNNFLQLNSESDYFGKVINRSKSIGDNPNSCYKNSQWKEKEGQEKQSHLSESVQNLLNKMILESKLNQDALGERRRSIENINCKCTLANSLSKKKIEPLLENQSSGEAKPKKTYSLIHFQKQAKANAQAILSHQKEGTKDSQKENQRMLENKRQAIKKTKDVQQINQHSKNLSFDFWAQKIKESHNPREIVEMWKEINLKIQKQQ